ncbi:MAG: hypothetical protein M3Y33_06200 [Actinomycetota bacterium]|nr:hypothetical protein [Actinomycetota bacterium]
MSDPDAPGYWDHEDDRDDPGPPAAALAVSVIRQDTQALIGWAASVRGQVWADRLGMAMVAAASAGWEWERAAREACRLILRPGGEPRELTEAARPPVQRASGPSAPPAEWRQARKALAARQEDAEAS